ncbi:MAG: M20/M25/M40 family metallo-hydrolase [Planctomycetota bacterium]
MLQRTLALVLALAGAQLVWAQLVWAQLVGALLAQAPAGGGTAAPPELPDLGPPAALPEGAPPHAALIDRNNLRTHAYWLACDERAGRFTSSKGQNDTARYVAEHFKKLGLKPLGDKRGFLQNYPLVRTYLDPATSLAFGDQKVTTDFAVLNDGSAMKVTLSGRFVWCGNGSADQISANLEGKLPLVVLHGLQGGRGAGSDLQAIQRFLDISQKLGGRGASAGVVCLLDDQGPFGNTLNYKALLPDHARLEYGGKGASLQVRVPLFVLSAAHSKRLFAHLGIGLDDNGAPTTEIVNDKATAKLAIVVKQDPKGQASNVVAVLEGTGKKSEAVVYSAHHDHVGKRLDGDVFNGADDNASGTAGLLEIAEAYAKGGERPERSIVFLSVSGEELGLWGSAWFADNPTWPLDKIVADINIDMIGRAGQQNGNILMQVTPSHDHEKYSTIVRDGVALGAKFGITFTSGDQYYARSDHYNFAKKDVPVVFFCDGEHPDYHQVTDSADRLDYVAMEAIARLAFWTGWQVAQDKSRPKELGKQPQW